MRLLHPCRFRNGVKTQLKNERAKQLLKKIENAQSFLHALDLKLLRETQYSVGSDGILDAGISVVFLKGLRRGILSYFGHRKITFKLTET